MSTEILSEMYLLTTKSAFNLGSRCRNRLGGGLHSPSARAFNCYAICCR